MLELRQKVSPREVVVGWFSTGDEINATSAVIHAFYCKKDEKGRVRLNMTILPRHTETYRDNIIIMSRGGFGLLSGTWRHFTEIFALLWELFFFSQYLISHISYLISHPSLSLSLSLFLGLSRCIRVEPSTSFPPLPSEESSQFNPTAVLPGPLHLLIDTSLVQQSRPWFPKWRNLRRHKCCFFLSTGKDQKSAESSIFIHSYQCLIFFDGKIN